MRQESIVRPAFALLFFVFGFVTTAAAQVIDPASSEILKLVDGDRSESQLTLPFKAVVWNIQKAENARMVDDFKRLGSNAQISLFQEAVDKKEWLYQLRAAKPSFNWWMAQSFHSDWLETSTGVALGSRVVPLRMMAARSSVVEPVVLTPKTILLAEYKIAGAEQTLLVANVHAINFRETGAFETHMSQLFAMIASHEGPMIVAGDFNTWNSARLTYLVAGLASLGLSEVTFDRQEFLVLDHVFVRGLDAKSTGTHFDVSSSDHFPLTLEIGKSKVN